MNRRSGSSILRVANVLSGPLRHSGALDGDAGLGLLQAPPGTASGQVRAATFDTWPEEIAWICDQIVERAPHRRGAALGRHRRADQAQRRHRRPVRAI